MTDCNGANAAIVSSRSCIVPVLTLKNLPYELEWTESVYATVQAYNSYGNSGVSLPGNGAVITTVPDPPVNLANDPSLTTAL
jgi:hypothetical protein